jgi:sugar/nucleoside kinase (ribokinase family)
LLVGLCTVDLVQRVADLPSAGQKLQSTGVEVAAGGPATNAAVTVAALGGRADLVTVLGAHPLAGIARDDLVAHGVRVFDALPNRSAPPTLSSVAVRERDGERSVVSYNAADIPGELPMPSWPALLAGAGALLVDGHHPRLALAAARAARGRRVPVVLDAGSDKPVFDELLPLVDVCACAGGFRLGRNSVRATEKAVHELGVPVVIRTNGADAVRWSVVAAEPRGGRRARPMTGTVDPPPVVAMDTLGAGDAWHGALAHGIAGLGRVPTAEELPGLVTAANRVATTRVASVGARAWLRELVG